MTSLSFTSETNGLYAEISGDIDHHSAAKVRSEIDNACDKYCPETLYMDLSGVSFMDSSGIGLVLGRYRNMLKKGCNTAVIVPEGRTRRILEMAAVDKFVRFYGNTEEI